MVNPRQYQRARRSVPHRIAIWIAAGTLALTLYVASYPIAFQSTTRHMGQAFQIVQTVYAPLFLWVKQPQWLGSAAYGDYCSWAFYHLNEPEIGNAASNARLDVTMSMDFSGTPLRDVVEYISEVNAYPIELDSEVDGDAEVTLQSTGPLRDTLKQLLEPLGLMAWPIEGRIVIGTPAAIQRVRANDRANHPLPTCGWILVGLSCVSAVSLLILLRRRRPSIQQATQPGP